MSSQLDSLRTEAINQLTHITTLADLDAWHSAVFGRKGSLTNLLGTVGSLPREERPVFGQTANQLKLELQTAYDTQLASLKE
jgi:phenylalanyl-tRNA synthetase alpha chain